MNEETDPDLRALMSVVKQKALRDFGSAPDDDKIVAFVRDLLYGPRQLWGCLRAGLIAQAEISSALADRIHMWLVERSSQPWTGKILDPYEFPRQIEAALFGAK